MYFSDIFPLKHYVFYLVFPWFEYGFLADENVCQRIQRQLRHFPDKPPETRRREYVFVCRGGVRVVVVLGVGVMAAAAAAAGAAAAAATAAGWGRGCGLGVAAATR